MASFYSSSSASPLNKFQNLAERKYNPSILELTNKLENGFEEPIQRNSEFQDLFPINNFFHRNNEDFFVPARRNTKIETGRWESSYPHDELHFGGMAARPGRSLSPQSSVVVSEEASPTSTAAEMTTNFFDSQWNHALEPAFSLQQQAASSQEWKPEIHLDDRSASSMQFIGLGQSVEALTQDRFNSFNCSGDQRDPTSFNNYERQAYYPRDTSPSYIEQRNLQPGTGMFLPKRTPHAIHRNSQKSKHASEKSKRTPPQVILPARIVEAFGLNVDENNNVVHSRPVVTIKKGTGRCSSLVQMEAPQMKVASNDELSSMYSRTCSRGQKHIVVK